MVWIQIRPDLVLIWVQTVLFGLVVYVPVNSYGHVGTVSSPNLTFLPSLTKQLTSTLYILLLVTDNNTSGISRREENYRRHYFMINLNESMGLG